MKTMNMLNEKGLDLILDPENCRAAYLKVKANKGKAGVDGIGVDDLAEHIRKHWPSIKMKLRSGTYQPGLLLPAFISKGGGQMRELGIPNTQDRLIQQAIAQPLSEVFEPLFSEHSYGYRPKRSAHDAVKQMQHYVVEEECGYVVDVDIHRFFDEMDHDILMREVAKEVQNKGVLRLIGSYLRAGKLVNHQKVHHTGKGAPQGGPLSPLLANIYLTPLDRELEKRGLRFIRYADDLTIYVKSPRSAERILESLTDWIKKHLKLRVNQEKSGTRPPDEGNFLGFRVEKNGKLALSEKSIRKFKEQVRQLLNARVPWRWNELVKSWRRYVQGWMNYCGITEWYEPEDLSRWCRRHVRKLCWQRWHNWRGRRRAFERLGAKRCHLRTAHSSRGAWRIARSPALHALLDNKRLRAWGFVVPEDLVKA